MDVRPFPIAAAEIWNVISKLLHPTRPGRRCFTMSFQWHLRTYFLSSNICYY